MGDIRNIIRAVFVKDLVVELRTKQLLPTQICLGILIAWIFRLTAGAMSVDAQFIAGAVLFTALLFAGILASDKSFAVEQENDCISSLLLATTDAGNIYIAKLLVNIALMCIFEIVTVPVVLMLFNVSVEGKWPQLIIVLLLANIGISSVGTLLGCIIHEVGATNLLLGVLAMAVLMPMMIPAVAALLLLFSSAGNQQVINIAADFKGAAGYMAAFDAIFVTVCWLLFGVVIKR